MGLNLHLGASLGNGLGIGAAVHVVGNGDGLITAKASIGIAGQNIEHIRVLLHQLFAQLKFLHGLWVWLAAVGGSTDRACR